MPDSRIDFSGVSESSDAELQRARRVGRPKSGQAKQLIAIRISLRLRHPLCARWLLVVKATSSIICRCDSAKGLLWRFRGA